MNLTDVYQQNEDCLIEDMHGEMLLYHPTTAVTLHLNGPSAIIWQLCDGERSVQKIIGLVAEAYPDQSDQIAEDVVGVIEDFFDRKVLQLVGRA